MARRRRSRRNVAIAGAAALLAAMLLSGCSAGSDRPAPHETTADPLVYLSHSPATTPARTFAAGSYLVGQDIELGRYSAGADVGRCSWVQRDSAGKLLDRSGDGRPTQILTLSARGTQLVVAGAGCTFVRLP